MEDTLAEYHANLRKEQAEVALHRPAVKQQWKTKDGTFQVKQKQPVQKDQKKDQMDGTSPEPEEATFSEMLRDVWEMRNCLSIAVAWNRKFRSHFPAILAKRLFPLLCAILLSTLRQRMTLLVTQVGSGLSPG